MPEPGLRILDLASSPLLAQLSCEAGITRLADLTGLDHLGVPVWQAVRPWSLALSVHQGKGVSSDHARLGAVMEAIECHHAEQWRAAAQPDAARRLIAATAWNDLPRGERTPAPDDFARCRGAGAPAEPCEWWRVDPVGDGPGFLVPASAIPLECSAAAAAGGSIDSSGQAAHFTRAAATLTGLLEVIERDAVVEWEALGWSARGGTRIDCEQIAEPTLQQLAARLRSGGVELRLYTARAVIALPVVVATLGETQRCSAGHEIVTGSAARATVGAAAVAAVLEAIQTRATYVAGARDTIPRFVSELRQGVGRRSLGMPVPGWRGHAPRGDWAADGTAPCDAPALARALAASGYPQCGSVLLSPPGSAAITVKVFVPGLGAEPDRRRRAP